MIGYLLLFSLIIFLIVFSYFFIDKTVALYFEAHKDIYDHIGTLISKVGESHWYLAAGLLGFLFFKYIKKDELYKNRALFLLYVNLFSGFISIIFKWFFARVRPWGLEDNNYGFLLFKNFDMDFLDKLIIHFKTLSIHPGLYASFPSGHTTTVFAVATYFALLIPRYIYLWYTLAFIVASSRILALDHFVSDIIAGATVGVVSTMFVYSKMKLKD